jgi:excinuclease ABC subunit A
MDKPDIDHIEGLSPAISIEQKSTSHNPRSTVGTITEIHDYLRLLFARVGTPRCPDHHFPLEAQIVSQMVDQVLAMEADDALAGQRWMLLALVRERKGEHVQVFEQLRAQGFVRVRVNGAVYDINDVPSLNLRQKHTIEAVIDRFKPRAENKQRLANFETALSWATARSCNEDNPIARRCCSRRNSRPVCDYAGTGAAPVFPSMPEGRSGCDGPGVAQFFDPSAWWPSELSLAGAMRG